MGPAGGGRLIVLLVFMTTEILSTHFPSDGDNAEWCEVQTRLVNNLGSRLTKLEAEVRHQFQIKRCETGGMIFRPHLQPGVRWTPTIVGRTHRMHIKFSRPFATKPWVFVSINHFDVSNRAFFRINVHADAISTSGFNAHAAEWIDTYNVAVGVSWVACNI